MLLNQNGSVSQSCILWECCTKPREKQTKQQRPLFTVMLHIHLWNIWWSYCYTCRIGYNTIQWALTYFSLVVSALLNVFEVRTEILFINVCLVWAGPGSLIMTEEWVVFRSAMKIDSHENKPMRNFHKEVEELQWNLKYLWGNKHTRINRHWGKNGTAMQPCMCFTSPVCSRSTCLVPWEETWQTKWEIW